MNTPKLPELWPPSGACRLCGGQGPLSRGHVIPKFVIDWMRETNYTGKIRSTDAPNRLVEDGQWRHMLCAACEVRFSQWESDVATRVFLPVHNDGATHFRYGSAFSRFAVSVLWRALMVMQAEGGLGDLDKMPVRVESALAAWRAFLLGNQTSLGAHDVHAFLIPIGVPPGAELDKLSPHLGRFLTRTVAQGSACQDGFAYVVVKMCRVALFGTVESGGRRREWRGTKLHASGGAWDKDAIVPGWVFNWLAKGAGMVESTVDTLSDKQKNRTHEKIMDAFRADPEGLLRSGIGEGWKLDAHLFGRRSLQKSFDRDGE